MVFKFFKNKLSKEKQDEIKSDLINKSELATSYNVDTDLKHDALLTDNHQEQSTVTNLENSVDTAIDNIKNNVSGDSLEPYTTNDIDKLNNDTQLQLAPEKKSSWRERLFKGLSKTRDSLGKKVLGVFGGGKIDEDLYEELETVLLSADIGVNATNKLLEEIRKKVSLKGLKDSNELYQSLKDSILEILLPLEKPLVVDGHKPYVIMLSGINGAGKTTTIGKLAKYYQSQGKSVMLAAGDTFRAAAREQLLEWGRRNNVTVVSQQGGDSAAVCFDAINSAKANKIDIVLADTAGRLPTQLNLMEEIKKVKRVIGKALEGAPHEVLLVLDANIGQNAINQVCAFDDALGLTGLVLTKLDGTAKGGVICAIGAKRPIPLRFIGVGEGIDDLRPFVAKEYVDALL